MGSWMHWGTALTAMAGVGCRTASPAAAPRAQVQEVMTQAVAVAGGKPLRTQVLEVRYPPGGASESHRHPCAVIGYIIEGELRSAVGDGPERVYHSGQSFYEPANALHRISANASPDLPARFIATFICDTAAPPMPASSAELTSHRGALE